MRHQTKILLIIIAFITLSSCNFHRQNAWTKQYEQEIYKETYDEMGEIIKDSTQRKLMALYTVQQLKKKLPYGLYSISNDSLSRLCARIGDDYAETHNLSNLRSVLKWTSDVEAGLRRSLLKSKYLKDESEDDRNKFCTCFISKLKYIYPDSLVTPIPDSVYTTVVNECNTENSKP